MEFFMHLTRTIVFYFLLTLLVRFLGKREIGKLGVFDLVMLLMIANIASITVEDLDIPIWYFIVIIVIIGLLQKLISYIELKRKRIRSYMDGYPSVVVYNGKLNISEMKKNLYNFDDLLMQLRLKNVEKIDDVKIAILEHNGDLSVYQKDETSIIPLPVIVSGRIVGQNLYYLGIDEDLVNKLLEKNNLILKEVCVAYYVNNDLLLIKSMKEIPIKKKKSKNVKKGSQNK